jgi:Holliday junction resolvasome RuvABC endonuclease subunit
MRVLAVDQSFTSSGIVILEHGGIVHAERYQSNKENDSFSRAWEISQYIKEIACKYNVDFTAIEGLAFSKFGDATRDLAGLQYAIVTTLRFVENLEVIVIPPNTVKKVATGRGNANKEVLYQSLPTEVKQLFEEKMNLKKTTGLYDLTDAYWIGRAALIEKNNRRER